MLLSLGVVGVGFGEAQVSPGRRGGLRDASEWGVVADGSTDDTDAWLNAIAAMKATKGGTLTFPATGLESVISAPLVFTGAVGLWGDGGKWGVTGTGKSSTFKTVGTGCVQFGDGTTNGDVAQLPKSGNFQINGSGGGATDGLFKSALNIEGHFDKINIVDAPGDAALVAETQNTLFTRLSIHGAAQDGLVIDKGAGSIAFVSGEIAGCGRDHLSIRNTAPSTSAGYTVVSAVDFYNVLFEFKNADTTSFRNMARCHNGNRIGFHSCSFGAAGVNGSASRLLHLDTGSYLFDGHTSIVGNDQATGAVGLWAKNATLHLNGPVTFHDMPTAMSFDTLIHLKGSTRPTFSNVTTRYATASGASTANHELPQARGAVALNPVGTVFTFDPYTYAEQTASVSANSTSADLPATGLAGGILPGTEFTMRAFQATAGARMFAWPSNVLFTGPAPTLGTSQYATVAVTVQWLPSISAAHWIEKSRSG